MLGPVLAVALAAAIPGPSPSPVESELAAAARREAERRRRTSGGRRVYDDADLRPPREEAGAKQAGSTESAGEQATPAVSYAPKERSGGDGYRKEYHDPSERDDPAGAAEAPSGEFAAGRPERETWARHAREAREKIAAARREQAGNAAKQDALRARLNPMSSTYTIDTNEQLQIQSDLNDLEAEALPLRATVAAAEAELARIEEGARRQGVPARWLEPDPQ